MIQEAFLFPSKSNFDPRTGGRIDASTPPPRETSRAAYHELVSDGTLARSQLEVYRAVVENGPCTSAEAFEAMRSSGRYENPITQSRARFTELRKKGFLIETGKRKCRVTGKTAILWSVGR